MNPEFALQQEFSDNESNTTVLDVLQEEEIYLDNHTRTHSSKGFQKVTSRPRVSFNNLSTSIK